MSRHVDDDVDVDVHIARRLEVIANIWVIEFTALTPPDSAGYSDYPTLTLVLG